MRPWAAFLLGAACSAAPQPAPKGPPPGATLGALERCADAAERDDEMTIAAFIEACGDGGSGITAYERLERAAGTMRERRIDAIAAGRDDLVERVDRALSGRTFLLPLDARASGWDLPAGAVIRPPTQDAYTVATADEIRREQRSYARLSPADDPPIAELPSAHAAVIAYPILVVADRALPAARVLSIALAHATSSADLAVVGPDGEVGAHVVQLSAAEGARPLTLPVNATVADLAAALDGAARDGAATATVAP